MSRVVIVTGSGSGIGAATAIELARRGWSVVINFSKHRESAEQVQKRCPDSLVVQADVGEDADCKRLVQAALERWGRVDALVNNAGTTKSVAHANLEELSADDFLRVYRLNVVGPFQMVRACAPALKAANGAVVNVSSVAAHLGTGSSIAYAASKAALNTMSLSLARVLGPEVRVNTVSPGYVNTPWQAQRFGEAGAKAAAERFAKLVPLKEQVRAEDVADAIAWLLEGARSVTGETIYVDGGMHIQPPG
jgi:3-oxoacyl-[acyl-carrier protein] reductase